MPIAELRRRFGLDEPDAVCRIERDGQAAYVGLPEREATKIADLWAHDEIGIELSVEVRAPVVVGIYPMRIARFVTDGYAAGAHGNGHASPNGHGPSTGAPAYGNGQSLPVDAAGAAVPPRPVEPDSRPVRPADPR